MLVHGNLILFEGWVKYVNWKYSLHNKQEIHLRAQFDYFECFLVITGILRTSFLSKRCSNLLYTDIIEVFGSLKGYRILKRIVSLKINSLVVVRGFLITLLNLTSFLPVLTILAIFGYSALNGSVLSCNLDHFRGKVLSKDRCLRNGGNWEKSILNYRTFLNSLLSVWAGLENSMWSTILRSSIYNWTGSTFYIVAHFMIMVLLAGFLRIIMKGSAISICYIYLGSSSIVNKDEKTTLSPHHAEFAQIQEAMSSIQFNKKIEKIQNTWSLKCATISASVFWSRPLNISILCGFILNLTMYPSII